MQVEKRNSEKKIKQRTRGVSLSSSNFSTCQRDILFMLFSSLDENDEEKKEYIFRVKDIELITGRKWNFQELRESTKKLGSQVFEIETEKSLEQFWLFSKVEYYDREEVFGIVINSSMKKYLFDYKFKNNFSFLDDPKKLLETP